MRTQLFLWICSVQWASDSPSRILRSLNLSQNQANSAIIANFPNCRRFSTDFALRRVLWRRRNAHSVKERLFLSSKNGMNSFAFYSCPIYKSYIGQINRKWNKSALLIWAIWRRPFISSDRSRGLLSITQHHNTQRWEIQWSSQIHSGINNICQILWEAFNMRHRIMLKLQTSEQTPLMWKPGETLFNKYKSPPFTMDLT